MSKVKQIPIQNIYYLLCYSWNKLEEQGTVDIAPSDSTQLVDLFAKVLIGGTNHVLRRGLDRGYTLHSEDCQCIRGKIDFNRSIKENSPYRGRLHCHFNELNYNVLHNQILKTTLSNLIKAKGINEGLKNQLTCLRHRFLEVTEIPLAKRLFGLPQLNSNNFFYDFLLRVCELVFDSLIPDEPHGRYKFTDFLQDERQMSHVFEEFVRNFYRLEQKKYKVSTEYIDWDVFTRDEQSKALLPKMKTDISNCGKNFFDFALSILYPIFESLFIQPIRFSLYVIMRSPVYHQNRQLGLPVDLLDLPDRMAVRPPLPDWPVDRPVDPGPLDLFSCQRLVCRPVW